jgi:hypothetical protein
MSVFMFLDGFSEEVGEAVRFKVWIIADYLDWLMSDDHKTTPGISTSGVW